MLIGTVLLAGQGVVIDPVTGEPGDTIVLQADETVSFDAEDSIDYGTFRVILSGKRIIYPAGSGGQIVETTQPLPVRDVIGDDPQP